MSIFDPLGSFGGLAGGSGFLEDQDVIIQHFYNGNGNAVGVTAFASPWYDPIAASAALLGWITIPVAGVIDLLRVSCTVGPAGGGDRITMLLRAAGGGGVLGMVATVLTADLAPVTTFTSDLVNSVVVAAGAEVTFTTVRLIGSVTAAVRCTIAARFRRT